MSNDRVSLKCKKCGAEKVIFKYYPGDALFHDYGIGEYAKKHFQECHPNGFEPDLGGNPGFVLVTESKKENK